MPLANFHPLPCAFAIYDMNMDIPVLGQASRNFGGKPWLLEFTYQALRCWVWILY